MDTGTCCWCGDEHELNPACNEVMGIHIADLEERDNMKDKTLTEQGARITELNAIVEMLESDLRIAEEARVSGQKRVEKAEADRAKLREACREFVISSESILWKLEHFHEFERPERNAFIENAPIHIRAEITNAKDALQRRRGGE